MISFQPQDANLYFFLKKFRHEGHKKPVLDFDWNLRDDFYFLSIDAHNIDIWKLVSQNLKVE